MINEQHISHPKAFLYALHNVKKNITLEIQQHKPFTKLLDMMETDEKLKR